jgi:4-hydroxybenzoate polyprenyltransferase
MRLDKPIGILLLLWPTLWALWVASDGRPAPWVVAIFVVGTVLMRSAGCVINDYADKDFDGHVERTRNRPLAARRSARRRPWGWRPAVAAVLPAGAALNGLTIAMSVPAVFLAGSYPYTKRFLAIPQAYLGIAFGFGIPMAFAAFQNDIPLVAWVMLLANVFWAVAYDTEYAMVDRPTT